MSTSGADDEVRPKGSSVAQNDVGRVSSPGECRTREQEHGDFPPKALSVSPNLDRTRLRTRPHKVATEAGPLVCGLNYVLIRTEAVAIFGQRQEDCPSARKDVQILEGRTGARLRATPRWISVSRNLARGNYESVALPLSYPGGPNLWRTCERRATHFTTTC